MYTYLTENALLLEFCNIRDKLNDQMAIEQVVWINRTTMQCVSIVRVSLGGGGGGGG